MGIGMVSKHSNYQILDTSQLSFILLREGRNEMETPNGTSTVRKNR